MCTLTLAWRVFPDAPVAIAANRDEDPRREALAPSLWPDGRVFAGRDARAGGTWLGVNRDGVVVGVTNLWGHGNDPSRRSRGLLVADALRATTARAAAEGLAALPADAVNPCVLLVVDGDDAFRVDVAGAPAVTRLAPGFTVHANWALAQPMPRSTRALALAAQVPTESFAAALPALERLVADHEGAELPGMAICTHGERYATVSSTILAVGGGGVRWRDVAGNPCRGGWIEREVRFA